MSELTDRYVGATLRSIPEKQRADIEAELRVSIVDAVEARVESGEDAEAAERVVLTGLGDPDRLAAGYAGRPGYLIGPDHFFAYKRLLTVLLITVVPIVAVVIGVVQAVSGDDFGSVVGHTFSVAISLIVHMVFWTTLVFAIVERSDHKTPANEWALSDLPPSLTVAGTVKFGETIATVVFLVFAIAAISLSQTISPLSADDGTPIPIFDPELWSFWFPFFMSVLALEIVFEVVKFRIGRWTWGLASVNLALNALFAVPAVYLLVTEQVFNPVFFDEIGWGAEPASNGSLVVVTMIAIAGIALWDVIDGFRKARK